jgi:hypothetical protein
MAEVRRTGREIIKRLLLRSIAIVVLSAGAIYLCDYLLLRIRIATNRAPYGTVTITPYYAVPQKDGKTQFMFDDPEDETCVHSLFPHVGDEPCWYLSRKKEKRIDI